ncbi:MAG: DUF2721 domain-containing protein [Verrucomicrobia bacterium]|nr:DUF2721 domain-containing protein [Verrucomicrobiota bacterium]
MNEISVAQLVPVLQTAIGPVILISGVGLLLLTMTNRLGRAIDRARTLADALPSADGDVAAAITAQLRIFWRRARLIRLAIILASLSALSAAILIIVLFLTALWSLEAAWFIGILFTVSMSCLILSLIVFIHDTNQSLTALKMELKRDGVREL